MNEFASVESNAAARLEAGLEHLLGDHPGTLLVAVCLPPEGRADDPEGSRVEGAVAARLGCDLRSAEAERMAVAMWEISVGWAGRLAAAAGLDPDELVERALARLQAGSVAGGRGAGAEAGGASERGKVAR